MTENKKKRSRALIALIILLALSILVSAGSTAYLSYTSMRSFEKLGAQLQQKETEAESETEEEPEESEDDVVIADEYTIHSTRQISDAYLSGDLSALSDRDKETLDMAKKVLASEIKDGMSDYEKELAIYQWLTTKLTANTGLLTVIPTTEEGVDTPYGVLKNHSAVCVGYATTFRLFMQMLGIECMVVHNLDRYHSWDLVKLDGDWYHVDCYSGSDTGSMACFNMNDAAAFTGHDWNTSFFPAANGTRYSPAMMNRKTVKDIYALPSFVKEALDQRETCVSIEFKKEIDRSTEPAAAAMVDRLTQAIWNGDTSDLNDFNFQWVQGENGQYVLEFFVTYSEEPYDPDLDDETNEKINEAISEVFGAFEYDDSSEDWEDAVG